MAEKIRLEGFLSDHTTDDAVRAMTTYARSEYTDPRVKAAITEVTKDLHPSDKKSQMIAVRNWVLSTMKYVKDEDEGRRLFGTTGDIEMLKSPVGVLTTKRYDCDCVSVLIAAIFLALGIQTQFVVVAFHSADEVGPDGFEHVFVRGYDDRSNAWMIIDPVAYPNEVEMIGKTQFYRIYDV